jgi:hypothetical protein
VQLRAFDATKPCASSRIVMMPCMVVRLADMAAHHNAMDKARSRPIPTLRAPVLPGGAGCWTASAETALAGNGLRNDEYAWRRQASLEGYAESRASASSHAVKPLFAIIGAVPRIVGCRPRTARAWPCRSVALPVPQDPRFYLCFGCST